MRSVAAQRRAMTIRFTKAQHELLAEEAKRQGLTFTEFVRTAAVATALYERAKREPNDTKAILELMEQLRQS